MPDNSKERVKRYRERQKALQSVTDKGKNVTVDVTVKKEQAVNNLHPIVYMLADPIKREKLERICESLGQRGLLDKVSIGTVQPMSMVMVNELLDAFT